jgi:Tfp pilus assembly protein PilX
MKRRWYQMNNSVNNSDGSVTIAALLILAVLTILGVSSISTSNMEVQIATNDKVHKMAFYAADGGSELGTELLELNIACASGFSTDDYVVNNITVVDRDFWMQTAAPGPPNTFPSDTERDALINNAAGTHTNLSMFGTTVLGVGGAIQLAAGYEGKGKGAAGGGTALLYEIHSQHLGLANSESVVAIQWRHNIGSEGTCIGW